MKEALKKAYLEWEQEILLPFKSARDDNQYSSPFYMGYSQHYSPNKKTIMVIGQEARDWRRIDTDWSIDDIQKHYESIIARQLFGIRNNSKFLKSAFWRLIRYLQGENFNVVWNNLDKLHRYDGKKSIPLELEDETELNRQYGTDKKSLLEREIDIINPDHIIFVTGPAYYKSMCTCFGIKPTSLVKYRPNNQNLCTEIDNVLNYKGKAIWTYHPTYLSRIKAYDKCVSYIKERIKD
ncbi:hypothetical protein [Acetanaerobacterium elongatum]|uniref:Uracil DNA glycosylase superfamily protein n=1 Tax=Acetanaerobacterium elongatum TaxID=258515 RepID=A0A1G9UZT2_9FIRM|nr:hypothetical protein [Acetanaerobacterium elongatum]SDM65297.1 hypothetical protein SAMN05192585_1033 [Acetanaerobacterium elongatum]